MVFTSLMPVVVGWLLVIICVLVFGRGAARADGLRSAVIPVGAVALICSHRRAIPV